MILILHSQHLTKFNCCLCSACFLGTYDLTVSICQVSLRQTWKKSPPSYTGTLKWFLCQVFRTSFCLRKSEICTFQQWWRHWKLCTQYEAILCHPSQPVNTTIHHSITVLLFLSFLKGFVEWSLSDTGILGLMWLPLLESKQKYKLI